MKVAIATDAHIYKTNDGKCWTNKIYGYEFWTRYLNVFSDVRIIARLKCVDYYDEKWLRVDGENVEVYGIPFFQGPKQLALNYFNICKVLKGAFSDCQAAIFRMPSQTAYMAFKHIPKSFPTAGEIVFDPSDSLNDHTKSLFMRLIDRRVSAQLSCFCKKANGVSYVTDYTIQKNYPSQALLIGESDKFFSSAYSTITLEENAFTGPRDYSDKKSLVLALSDVSMNSERKGERTLLKAVKYAVDKNYDVKAVIIGDGTKRSEFENFASEIGIDARVNFTGLLSSSDEVRNVLLESDIFVFPTKGEGLPRGVLEAMAIGMPVLASPAGGIPEVLDSECLIDPQDAEKYGRTICKLLDNPSILNEWSKKNFDTSMRFSNNLLQKKRDLFYTKLRNLAQYKMD